MHVRKSSWHYKLWMLGRGGMSQPRDLCRYFWHLMLVKLLAPFLIISAALIGVGALIWLVWGHPVQSGLIVLTSILIIGALLGLFWGIQKLVDRHQRKSISRKMSLAPPKPPKEPSVVWAYLKARKKKMCPLITVVDDTTGRPE